MPGSSPFVSQALPGFTPEIGYFGRFHVVEDGISHRGQIRWLRRRLPGGR